jgi:thioredoxin reductase
MAGESRERRAIVVGGSIAGLFAAQHAHSLNNKRAEQTKGGARG